jgi:membrane-associated phospholipid phosphatase
VANDSCSSNPGTQEAFFVSHTDLMAINHHRRPTKKHQALAVLIAMLLCVQTASSQRAPEQTAPNVSLFTRDDAYLGVAFLIATAALTPFDGRLAHRLQEPDVQGHANVHRFSGVVRVIAVPGSLVIGSSMYAIGRISHHERVADLGLHGTEGIVAGSVVSGVIKGIAGRSRPYVTNDSNPKDYRLFRGLLRGRDYSSFPSGHVLAAFAAASAVTAEVGRWSKESQWVVGPVLYTGAGAVAFSRLYDNQHWASDAILAAGIGTFAGDKVVRMENGVSHSHPRSDDRLPNQPMTTIRPGVRS